MTQLTCGVDATASQCDFLGSGGGTVVTECPNNQYRPHQESVVIPCQADEVKISFSALTEGQRVAVTRIPAGTLNLRLDVHSDVDFDIQVFDQATGQCIIG